MTDDHACVLCALRAAVDADADDLGRRIRRRACDLDTDAVVIRMAYWSKMLADAGEHDPAQLTLPLDGGDAA